MADPFAVETLLLQRLREQLPSLRAVQGARDEASLLSLPVVPPAVLLLQEGQKPLQAAGNQQVLEQVWRVVLVVRNLRDPGGEGERGEAAPLQNAILQALLGWQPAVGHAPMRLAPAKPPLFAHGHGYYPLCFVARMTITGA